ncbi:MAG TPA: ribosome recycling factor [Acidimicrobiales bacterium]|nr:ribosome recycling factor [Acidimicrobiales bacterium]
MSTDDDDVIPMVLDEARDKMAKAVSHARSEFTGVRTGRAAPALVEKLPVDYYGTEVPLQQIAGFTVPEARMLVISPYDKSSLGAIEKAIQQSGLGLAPSNDGQIIRLNFPPLTEERRKELVRLVKGMAEEGRVSIRHARRSARHELEAFEKDGDISADDLARAEKELDKLTHRYEGEVDTALEHKEQELLAT